MNGKKTYITALGAALSAVGGYLSGSIELADAVQLLFTAILGATLRHGMANDES